MADDLNLSMFRAYDIRTPAQQLTDDLACRLAAAEAVYFHDVLKVPGVLVAHDARRTGPHYLGIAVEAYRRAGLQVIYLPGVCSTPLFYYAAMRHPAYGGVMFGASHNPASDTGQKIVGPNVTPIAADVGPEGGLNRIRQLYVDGAEDRSQQPGGIRSCELLDDYVQYSMRLAAVEPGSLQGLCVLQDYLYGAAGREMLAAFQLAGATLEPLHFVADGRFPLGDPNPVKQAVISQGLDALETGDFRLANFFDGDGDRFDVYHGDGTSVASSFVYAAVLPEIRKRFPAEGMGVFADLKANPLAVIEMARTGVAVDVVRNGHSQIKDSLVRDPRRFGAVEESAHFYEAFSPDGEQRFCSENTLYIALTAARVWHRYPDRVRRLLDIQATTAREREWGYKFPSDRQRDEALQATCEHFEAQGAKPMTKMKNGMDLEATLLRRGLPFDIDQHTVVSGSWQQVCQRASQSEDHLARWEVVADSEPLVRHAKREIAEIVAPFGASEEYQG